MNWLAGSWSLMVALNHQSQNDLKMRLGRNPFKSWLQKVERLWKTLRPLTEYRICTVQYMIRSVYVTARRLPLIFNEVSNVPAQKTRAMGIVPGCGAGCMATAVRALLTVLFLVRNGWSNSWNPRRNTVRFQNVETKRDKPIFDGLRVLRWAIRM